MPESEIGGNSQAELLWWRYTVLHLRTPASADWAKVKAHLAGRRKFREPGTADTLIAALHALEVQSALVEFPYHDQDFAEEYTLHYAKMFRPGVKACTRLHFFKSVPEDLERAFAWNVSEKTRWGELEGLRGSYLGFCVIRPPLDAPIGRTVLKAVFQPDHVARTLSARHAVHLLSVKFEVEGFPFVEQDTRTGACAQAALWMALRHLTAADHTPWLSVPALTAGATSIADETNTLSIPMGSGGLGATGIFRGVQLANRIPCYFCASPGLTQGRYSRIWQKDEDPFALACCFVDSEIPVVVLLSGSPTLQNPARIGNGDAPHDVIMDDREAHAVTAIGYYGDNREHPDRAKPFGREPTERPHVSEWLSGLIVQNDQLGPNVELARRAAFTDPPTKGRARGSYKVEDICGLIVPLPREVFLVPAAAEELAWEFMIEKAAVWWDLFVAPKYPDLAAPRFFEEEELATRTFLIDGHMHYAGLARARTHPELTRLAARVHYPRHVWITEFYARTLDGAPDLNAIVGHVVTDATSAAQRPVAAHPEAGPDADKSTSDLAEAFMFGHVLGMASAAISSKMGEGQFVTIPLADDERHRPWRPMHVHARRVRRER